MNAQACALRRELRVRAGLVLALLALATALAALAAGQNARRATLVAQGAATRETVRYVLRDGGSLADAVPDLVDETDRVGLSVEVFDASGRALGGNATLAQPSAEHATPSASAGLQQLEVVPVSGGYIVLAPAAHALAAQFVALLASLAVGFGLAWCAFELLVRGSVARAFRRVDAVTEALETLGAGDLARRELVPAPGESVDGLTDAYNAAARRVAATVEARTATEERMRRFLGDAGHELRTPLAVINGYLDLLKRGALAEREAATKIVETMSEEGDRMTGMLERLLRLARLDTVAPAKLERVELATLARDLVASLAPIAGARDVAVTANERVTVLADSIELSEALRNLLDNAFKYAPGAAVRVDVRRAAKFAEVRVSDRGPGLSEDERAHAFERFFRGDSRGEVAGSGLGLSIVKRIVDRAGGSVLLEPVPEGGTCALVRLPLASEGTGTEASALMSP